MSRPLETTMKSGAPPCPYCSAPLTPGTWLCARCGRDANAPRRPCQRCGRVTPTSERICWNCGEVFKSDMRWKVPLIVALFLLSFILSIAVALVKVLLG
ncbi:MAG: Double zinc ribbon [Acidobacteriota bacterium]|nr:Double zinc ribbon [Acidobacteriota bacterium]